MLLSQLKLLVQLRYKLLWAHARTGGGKTLLFFALYFIGISAALLLLLGGIGAARSIELVGRAELLSRELLGTVFVNAVVISTLLEVGPSSVFTETTLRRYPMGAWERFLGRHLTGILEPVWPLATAVSVGLVIGFSVLHLVTLWIALPAVFLFVAVAYLCAAVLINIFARLLQTASGPLLVLLLIAASATGLPLLLSAGQGRGWNAIDAVVRLSPPGTAAAMMMGATTEIRLQSLALLLLWGVAAALLLRSMERPSSARRARSMEKMELRGWYDRVAGCFGNPDAPLVAKSLRYHLRCNRVRYNLLVTAPMFLFLTRMGHGAASFSLLLAYLFVAAFVCTLVMTVNQFGYDGAGIRRYPLLPVRFHVVLRAHSAASMLVGCVGAISVLALGLLALKLPLDYRALIFLISDMLAGLFFFHALGLWTSILAPRAADFNNVMGNKMSLPANLLTFSALGSVFAAMALLHDPLVVIARYWWAMPLVAAGCGGFYWISLHAMTRSMEVRRELLVQAIAGAASN